MRFYKGVSQFGLGVLATGSQFELVVHSLFWCPFGVVTRFQTVFMRCENKELHSDHRLDNEAEKSIGLIS